MSDHELALTLAAAGVGVDAQRRAVSCLIDRDGPVQPSDVLRHMARAAGRRADPAAGRAAWERVQRLGARVRLVGEAGYPRRLVQAWPELGAPAWLVTAGDATWADDRPCVAVVGTRRPTADGLATTRELAGALATAGATVVSGLARGIDQAAHRAALDAGGGTIAVLGSGHGVDYPRGTGALRRRITGRGMLVTELVPGTPPRPHHFLARNRIISGLCVATVVVEGHARSGALQTARLAASQGRDVWAVPGSLRSSASAAPLALIADGAQTVTSVGDLLDGLGLHETRADAPPAAPRPPGLDGTVLDLVGPQPTALDVLVEATGADVPAVTAAVARLRRRGLVVDRPSGVSRP